MNFEVLRSQLKLHSPISSAYLSMIACILFAFFGITIGYVEDSLAIRTNGIVAAIDIFNSFIVVAAINRSVRTPDYIFNYGYGKYESLGVLLSALLLTITLCFTLWQAVIDFRAKLMIDHYELLLVFSVLSFFIMRLIARVQSRRALRFKMPMLSYDAEIWQTDSYIELFVIVGLALGWICMHFGYKNVARIIDGISALVVLLFAMRVPVRHGKNAINQLLDKTLPDDIQFTILSVVAENFTKFCEFKAVHTRQSGKDIFVEIDVVMPFDYTFEQAFPVEQAMQNAIRALYPTAIVRIYAVPCVRDCYKEGVCFCPVKTALSK